jgi:hypothetical protein
MRHGLENFGRLKTEEELALMLEEKFRLNKMHYTDSILIWTSCMGVDGKTRYGSYKDIKKKDLIGRDFVLEHRDYAVGLFFTDVVHNPRASAEESNHIELHRKGLLK